MTMRKLASTLLAAGFIGCGGASAPDVDVDEPEEQVEDAKAEAFDSANNPARVDSSFIYEVAQLPVEGHSKSVPIAGDYWATARDSINYRWNGSEPSPAEKVEAGLGLRGFAKHITENYGIYQSQFRHCKESSECSDLMDGSSCVTPRETDGSDKPGRCIPGWWGICHGWAPYAFSEPAATKPVTKNGVTFYPGDLTALMSLVYGEDLPTKFLSGRCNLEDKKITYDASGRAVPGECRDNPGAIFVVATNLLGKRQQAFVVDRTVDWEVWNQPVEGYKITNHDGGKLKEVTKAQAIGLLGLGFDYAQLLPSTDLAKDQTKTGVYTATVAGTIVFKTTGTDGDADLFVGKGDAVTEANAACKSTGSSASEECKIDVAAGDKVAWLVKGYSASKQVALQVGVPGAGSNYVYNTNAKRFFHVELDLYWIGEQGPGMSMPDPRRTLKTDHMSFILEADDAGRVTGGEWIGESKKNHTDFIWWPTAKPRADVAGLTYEMVKALNDEASGGSVTPVPGPMDVTTVFEKALRYETAYDDQFGSYGAPNGAKKIEFSMTGTGGNADLYVRLGSRPTVYTFTAKSTGPDATEKVTVNVPAGGGTYYVRGRVPVGARGQTVNVKITARVVE